MKHETPASGESRIRIKYDSEPRMFYCATHLKEGCLTPGPRNKAPK